MYFLSFHRGHPNTLIIVCPQFDKVSFYTITDVKPTIPILTSTFHSCMW